MIFYGLVCESDVCLELTNSVSVGLLCSQLPLGLLDLVTHQILKLHNSVAVYSIAFKFSTEFHHVTDDTLQMFEVTGQKSRSRGQRSKSHFLVSSAWVLLLNTKTVTNHSPEIFSQPAPVGMKLPILNRYSLIAPQP